MNISELTKPPTKICICSFLAKLNGYTIQINACSIRLRTNPENHCDIYIRHHGILFLLNNEYKEAFSVLLAEFRQAADWPSSSRPVQAIQATVQESDKPKLVPPKIIDSLPSGVISVTLSPGAKIQEFVYAHTVVENNLLVLPTQITPSTSFRHDIFLMNTLGGDSRSALIQTLNEHFAHVSVHYGDMLITVNEFERMLFLQLYPTKAPSTNLCFPTRSTKRFYRTTMSPECVPIEDRTSCKIVSVSTMGTKSIIWICNCLLVKPSCVGTMPLTIGKPMRNVVIEDDDECARLVIYTTDYLEPKIYFAYPDEKFTYGDFGEPGIEMRDKRRTSFENNE